MSQDDVPEVRAERFVEDETAGLIVHRRPGGDARDPERTPGVDGQP